MSKGIVKITPKVTNRKTPGKLQVEEVDGVGNQRFLNTEIDFVSPTVLVFVGDYVEFTLDSADMGTVTKKIYSRGIIKELNNPTTGLGILKVTVVNPNTLGVVPLSDLSFYNYASLPFAVNDYVEFNNMTGSRCTVFRKTACVGSIQRLPGTNPGSILVTRVSYNTIGIHPGSTISFPLPVPVPSPFRQNDIIEFRIVGPGAGSYVQLLSPE